MVRALPLFVLVIVALVLSGCAVVRTTAAVTGAVVSTTVGVAGAAVTGTARAVSAIGADEDEDEDKPN